MTNHRVAVTGLAGVIALVALIVAGQVGGVFEGAAGFADGGALALRVYVHPERMAAPAFVDEALSASTPRRSG